MRHYEVTFIVDPVLSGDEVKSTAQNIQDEIVRYGASIVAVDELGLRQLAILSTNVHRVFITALNLLAK
jgi:small subunit ribosomal protein S6